MVLYFKTETKSQNPRSKSF